MEELSICKICKKVFVDMQGLKKHQTTHHSIKNIVGANNTLGDNNKEIPHHFRNNQSISITRIQNSKEPSANMQSAIMQNQNTFRKITAAQGTSNSVTIRRGEPDGRVKVPVHNPGRKNANSSIRTVVSTPMDADMDDGGGVKQAWQRWNNPPSSKGKAHQNVTPYISNTTDETIISRMTAERATTAIKNSGLQQVGRKGAPPQLIRVVPGTGKRQSPGVAAHRINPGNGMRNSGSSSSPVANIMQNLGKMKSMNAQGRPSPKMISVTPPVANKKMSQQQIAKQKLQQQQQSVQSFRANHAQQAPKNKILPRNSFNNALPKHGVQQAPRRPHISPPTELQEEDDSDEEMRLVIDERETTEAPEIQRTSHIPPPPTLQPKPKSGGGKASPPSKSLNTNRFNPLNSTNNSNAGSRQNQNGNSLPKANSTAKQNQNEPKPATVVAKKSAPPVEKERTQGLDPKYLKTYVTTMPGTDYSMPRLDAVGCYTGPNGEEVWECLVCQFKEHEESSRDMICCDQCEDWYHWECVGVVSSMPEQDPWYCLRCIYRCSTNPRRDFPTIFNK